MKISILILTGFFLVSGIATVRAADTKMWNEAYVHEQTNIILPTEIAGFVVDSICDFAEADYDGTNVSLRFFDEVTKADVYLYEVNIPEEDFLERSEATELKDRYAIEISEMSSTREFVRKKAEEGEIYHDVEIPKQADIDQFGPDDALKGMVSAIMRYRESKSEPDEAGFGQALRESCIAVSLVEENWFLKVRHTFVLAPEEEINEERRKKRVEFLGHIRKLISDPSVREEVFDAIGKLEKNPSDEDAVGTVVGYADASALVQVSISAVHLPFFAVEDFEGSTELLAAFIAGNIQAQFTENAFYSHHEEGVHRMLDAYAILREQGKCAAHEQMDQWLAAKKAGTLVVPKAEQPKPVE